MIKQSRATSHCSQEAEYEREKRERDRQTDTHKERQEWVG